MVRRIHRKGEPVCATRTRLVMLGQPPGAQALTEPP